MNSDFVVKLNNCEKEIHKHTTLTRQYGSQFSVFGFEFDAFLLHWFQL